MTPTEVDFISGGPEVNCPTGTTGIRFGDSQDDDGPLEDEGMASVTLPGETDPTTVTIFLEGDSLTFVIDNGLAAYVLMKGGTTQNQYDYTGASAGFPGPGIAHDDGLVAPTGISHVDFCLIPAAPDLEIEKSADVTSVNAGDSFTYTITVDNVGEGTATDVVISDDLDDSLTVDSATFSIDGGGDTACTVGAGNTISCAVGSLAGGAQAVATIEVTTSAESCDEVRNTSTVSAGNHDDVESNEVVVGVVCAPDLEIEKSADETSVNAGDSFTYTITVDNVGTATATDVFITDDLDDSLTVDSATFSVDAVGNTACTVGAGNTISCDVGDLDAGSQAVATIDVTTSEESCDEVRNTSTVSAGNHDDVDSNEVVVGVVCEELGSITVVKEITCEICETFTPGAFFNQGENNEMSAFAESSLSGDPIEVAGMTFDSVQDVQDNAAPGSLLRHYLALALNLRLADESECDLGLLVYDGSVEALQGMTVAEIAAEAEAVLNGEDSDFTEEQLHDAIDEINNNHGATDGVLVCDSEGTSVAGFEFTLFDDEDVEVGSGETGTDGTLTFSNLPLGTYTLVETGGPEGSDCSVVSASGDGVTFDEATGEITIVLTENNADVTVTVVNECDVPPPPELGSITIIKNAIPDDAQDFAFTTTGEGLEGFSLDDDADAALSSQITFDDLAAGAYTVTESETDGWELTSIDCSTGGSGNTGTRTASITLVGSENVTCTFVNTEEGTSGGELGSITIIKNAVPDAAQNFAFTTTGAGLSGFSLDDDADAALSNQRTFLGLTAGSYSVVEDPTTGWTLTSITCSTGGTGNATTRTASITLGAGQNVTCTFVNTQQGGGTLPGNPTTPVRTGTLANTAMEFDTTGSLPAAILALVMLSGLAAAGYAARAEVRRRR